MSDNDRKFRELHIEIEDIEKEIKSIGELLTNRAKLIVDFSSRIEGRQKGNVNFVPYRLAEMIEKLDDDYFSDCSFCIEMKKYASDFFALGRKKSAKERELEELNKIIRGKD